MTRMKESERCPWQVEEETQRQEESQEAAKSISPGSREFQGGGGESTEYNAAQSDLESLHWAGWPYLRHLTHPHEETSAQNE